MNIVTNNQPRHTIDASELTEKEREEFEYLDWITIDNGNDSATFFRYKGQLYDIGEFLPCQGFDNEMTNWHGYISDSAFSGIVIKLVDNGESVVVGRYYS